MPRRENESDYPTFPSDRENADRARLFDKARMVRLIERFFDAKNVSLDTIDDFVNVNFPLVDPSSSDLTSFRGESPFCASIDVTSGAGNPPRVDLSRADRIATGATPAPAVNTQSLVIIPKRIIISTGTVQHFHISTQLATSIAYSGSAVARSTDVRGIQVAQPIMALGSGDSLNTLAGIGVIVGPLAPNTPLVIDLKDIVMTDIHMFGIEGSVNASRLVVSVQWIERAETQFERAMSRSS
jgi:hypothetical protein